MSEQGRLARRNVRVPPWEADARLRRVASSVAMTCRDGHGRAPLAGVVPDVPVRGRHSMYALMTGTVRARRSRHGDTHRWALLWAASHQAGHTTSGPASSFRHDCR